MFLHNGLLVVIEGVNGSGKTSIISKIVEYFRSQNTPIVVYKFPNRSGKYGECIDQYLRGEININSKYDILNMFAMNRYADNASIESDLKQGKIVICDRYIFSAIAYHIPMHIRNMRKIELYCNIIGYFDKDMPIPDVVYLIDGDHIQKRGIVEIFHHTGNKSNNIKNMIYRVINNYFTRFLVIKNEDKKMNKAVNSIVNDIKLYLH